MKITSPAFQDNTKMPSQYACDGAGVNPPLTFSEVPANAKSLVLIVDDPDAPTGIYTHWILYNLDPKTTEIKEDSTPSALFGKTSAGRSDYVAACPPYGTHHYHFKLYALDSMLNLNNPDVTVLKAVIQNKTIVKAELIGLYSRN